MDSLNEIEYAATPNVGAARDATLRPVAAGSI
jgi:hypothetical protein